MTSQEDQGGARPTLSRGGYTKRSKTTTNQTKVQLEPAKRNSPPPLLYIPASPCPNYETPNTTNPGLHDNALNLQIDHSSSSHNSWPSAILHQQLENSNQRDMDTQHNTGLSYPARLSTETDQFAGVGLAEGQQRGLKPGTTQTPGEKHHHSSNSQQLVNLHLSHFHHPEKERGTKVDYQPQKFEQICQETAFQDGGSPFITRSADQRRLDGEN